MATAAQLLEYANLVAFTALGVIAVRQWHLRKDRASLWAALSFGALGVVLLAGRLLPEEPASLGERLLRNIDIAFLVLFPFLLYRFTRAFDPASRRLETIVTGLTSLLVAWTLFLPAHLPESGESRPAWFVAYLAAFVVHWTVLSVVVSWRLWQAGRGQPSVARRRMQMLALGATAITVAIVVAAAAGDDSSAVDVVTGGLALVSALGFLLGLAPPALVRQIWRRPEQRRIQDAIATLMQFAESPQEVAARVLAPAAATVGARAVALRNDEGTVLGTHNVSQEVRSQLEQTGWRPAGEGDRDLIEIEVPGGSLLVWTTPYAPYFGSEELRSLRTLGALTGIALDRSRLFAQEREARLALERADVLKTSFVALAAHELRTPVGSVKGIADTLYTRRDQLTEEQRRALEAALQAQAGRLSGLVEQLLDLSRLDAEAIEIDPTPIGVRKRTEELIAIAAGGYAPEVTVAIPDELVAVLDADVFDRVVANLVTNALRYGAPPITVGAEQSDRHFRFFVEDRGPGVPSEFVPSLFERFARSPTARDRGPGTGLGLAIARSYAQAHRGDLFYWPAEPSGARFELVVPASRAPSATA